MADDEVGAGVDGGMRERDGIAATLAEVPLRPRTDVRVGGPLRAGVHVHDDDVRAGRGCSHQLPGRVEVEQVGSPRVRSEAEHRHPDVAGAENRDLVGPAGRGHPCVP